MNLEESHRKRPAAGVIVRGLVPGRWTKTGLNALKVSFQAKINLEFLLETKVQVSGGGVDRLSGPVSNGSRLHDCCYSWTRELDMVTRLSRPDSLG